MLFTVLLLPCLAQADLYRWVDRETGQVKFSNTPPPWYGDPEKQRGNPPVEVIRYRSTVEKPKPVPEPEKSATAARALASLEARWLELARFIASLPPGIDLERAGPNIRQQLDDYQAISAELERIDPGGTARRQAQQAAITESARRALKPVRPRSTE